MFLLFWSERSSLQNTTLGVFWRERSSLQASPSCDAYKKSVGRLFRKSLQTFSHRAADAARKLFPKGIEAVSRVAPDLLRPVSPPTVAYVSRSHRNTFPGPQP